jgi:hypothetical protein
MIVPPEVDQDLDVEAVKCGAQWLGIGGLDEGFRAEQRALEAALVHLGTKGCDQRLERRDIHLDAVVQAELVAVGEMRGANQACLRVKQPAIAQDRLVEVPEALESGGSGLGIADVQDDLAGHGKSLADDAASSIPAGQ